MKYLVSVAKRLPPLVQVKNHTNILIKIEPLISHLLSTRYALFYALKAINLDPSAHLEEKNSVRM